MIECVHLVIECTRLASPPTIFAINASARQRPGALPTVRRYEETLGFEPIVIRAQEAQVVRCSGAAKRHGFDVVDLQGA